MRRIEEASDGTRVITSLVYIREADCFLLSQNIVDKGQSERDGIRHIITLSRDDIKAIREEVETK